MYYTPYINTCNFGVNLSARRFHVAIESNMFGAMEVDD